jgi:hypothetical protein
MRRGLAFSVGGRSGRVSDAGRCRQVKGHGEKLSRKAEQATVALLTPPGFAERHWAARRRAVEGAIASIEQTAGQAVDFEKGIVWIKWIGTHRDYHRIDATEVEHDR